MALSIETSSELDKWLETEADMIGLDPPTFAKTVLFKAMRAAPRPLAAPAPAVTVGTQPRSPATMAASEPRQARDEQVEADGYVDEDEHAPPQTPDIETIIAQRVAEALAQQPRIYQEGETGIQIVRRGLLPEFGGAANGGIPFRIQRHAVGG